jgi:hypothetical protein
MPFNPERSGGPSTVQGAPVAVFFGGPLAFGLPEKVEPDRITARRADRNRSRIGLKTLS